MASEADLTSNLPTEYLTRSWEMPEYRVSRREKAGRTFFRDSPTTGPTMKVPKLGTSTPFCCFKASARRRRNANPLLQSLLYDVNRQCSEFWGSQLDCQARTPDPWGHTSYETRQLVPQQLHRCCADFVHKTISSIRNFGHKAVLRQRIHTRRLVRVLSFVTIIILN